MATRNYTVISASWLGVPLTIQPRSGYGIQIEGVLEDVTGYGTASQTFAFTGELKRNAVKLSILYDDTATTGNAALFRGQEGTSGSLVLTTAAGKTDTGTAFIKTTNVMGKVGGMTNIDVEFQPSGAWVIV